MPVYNCLATLDNAVRSVLWQTCPDWELQIIDDGSNDGTLERARYWAACDQRIKVTAAPHGGITAALRLGLEACQAEYVARMDGDDISHPQRFAAQAQYLDEAPQTAALGSLVRIFPKIGITQGMRRYERWLNQACESGRLERDVFIESPLVHPSVMFRRSRILKVGSYLEAPWPEDYYLWLRLWLAGEKLAKVNRVLCFWRDTPKRLTRVDSRCGHDALRELKIEMFLQAYFPQYARLQLPSPVEASRAALTKGRSLIIWGAGPNGKALAKGFIARGLQPHAYVDIRPARRGQVICGAVVWGIDQLPAPEHYFLVTAVGNPFSRVEIRQHLDSHGWREGRDYRCLAGISD